MSARHLSPEQRSGAGRGDDRGHSRDSSSREGESSSSGSCSPFDSEDGANACANQTPAAQSPNKRKGPKASRAQARKSQPGLKLKKSHPVNRKALMFPPIKPPGGPKQRVQSAQMHRIKELDSRVWALQQQLSGAVTENKLLTQLQNRHAVALQRFQDPQYGLSQVLAKHSNEVRVLEELLRRCRLRCRGLAGRMQATDDELLHAKDSLKHLERLSQDSSLLEREELAQRLAVVTADRDRKDKRIQDLERNLKLSQASFNRQITTELRKKNEAKKLSLYLEEQIKQLTLEIKNRETELATNNIYSNRSPGRRNQKEVYPEVCPFQFAEKETKMVQPDEMSLLPIDVARPLELEYPNTEVEEEEEVVVEEQQSWELLAIEYPDPEKAEDDRSERDGGADSSDRDGGVTQENLNPQAEAGLSQPVRETEQTEAADDQASHAPEMFAHPGGNDHGTPRTRRHYTFKQTIENLHSGKPAYGVPSSHPAKNRVPGRGGAEEPASEDHEPSRSGLPGGESLRREGEGVRSRKRDLMEDLFGQGLVLDPVSGADRRGGGGKALTFFDT